MRTKTDDIQAMFLPPNEVVCIEVYLRFMQIISQQHREEDITPWYQRWLLKLDECQYEFEFIRGKENRVADFLSGIQYTEVKDKVSICPCHKTKLVSGLRIVLNKVDDNDVTMDPIHFTHEEFLEHIPVKIVSISITQIILTNNKICELDNVHKNYLHCGIRF